MSKLRTVGQARPVPSAPAVATIFLEIPTDGMTSRPARSAAKAALKNAGPLQNDTCPKGEPGSPSVHLPWRSAPGVAPTWRRIAPLNPMSMVTTACTGSFGTTGATAGLVPLVITRGSYTDKAPVAGFRIVAWTNAPRLTELIIWQPESAGEVP